MTTESPAGSRPRTATTAANASRSPPTWSPRAAWFPSVTPRTRAVRSWVSPLVRSLPSLRASRPESSTPSDRPGPTRTGWECPIVRRRAVGLLAGMSRARGAQTGGEPGAAVGSVFLRGPRLERDGARVVRLRHLPPVPAYMDAAVHGGAARGTSGGFPCREGEPVRGHCATVHASWSMA